MQTIYCLTCLTIVSQSGADGATSESHFGGCCDACLEESRNKRAAAEELLSSRS